MDNIESIENEVVQLCPSAEGYITLKSLVEGLEKDKEKAEIAYIEYKIAVSQLRQTIKESSNVQRL